MHNRDVILRSQRIIILVNDCFWLGHQDCGGAFSPLPDSGPWQKRTERLRTMNKNLWGRLTSKGWTVIITWKCERPGHAGRIVRKPGFPHFFIILLKEISRLKLLLLK